MFPLKLTQLKSMRKMQLLQPQITKINDKYKGVGMSDPRSQQKQAEVMELYKKHGVNPMGGCLPMVIQLPFLYAFYKVLAVSVEMRHATWLWVPDLTQPERYGIHFLPLIMILTQRHVAEDDAHAYGRRSQPAENDAVHARYDGYLLLVSFERCVLYYLTSNLVGVGQQWFFNKTTPPVLGNTMIRDGRKKA